MGQCRESEKYFKAEKWFIPVGREQLTEIELKIF
jgi:hypothetical protein